MSKWCIIACNDYDVGTVASIVGVYGPFDVEQAATDWANAHEKEFYSLFVQEMLMTTAKNYQVQVSVEVTDVAELRDYAMKRACDAGMSKKEFLSGEACELADNIEYYLGWAFDAGTPEEAGFRIEQSSVTAERNVP